MDGHELSVAVIEAIGQFAGTLTSPLALGGVVIAICLTRRPLVLRLLAVALGLALAAAPALAAEHPVAALLRLTGAVAACLLQVEVYLAVVLPLWRAAVRLWQALLAWLRGRPLLPPER